MFRSITVVAAVAAVLVGGALSGLAANSHGAAVSKVAATTSLKSDAGGGVRAAARTNGDATSDAAKTDAAADAAANPAHQSADQTATTTGGDAHGDAVSMVAKSDMTATCAHGGKTVTNHGCAVSAVAHKH